MASADPDRFEPLLEIRKVAQRAEVGRVAEAATAAARRERELRAADEAVAAARAKLAAAEDRLGALAGGGASAATLALAGAYAGRCRGGLRKALADRAVAEGALDASAATLQEARERLVAARNHREVIERFVEQRRKSRQQLRERREE
jgi:hypothetical protein